MWAAVARLLSPHTSGTTQLPVQQTSWPHSPEAAECSPRLGLREELQAASAPTCSIWDWLLPAALGVPNGQPGAVSHLPGLREAQPCPLLLPRTEHKPAAHQGQHTAEPAQRLWSHRSKTCSCHLQLRNWRCGYSKARCGLWHLKFSNQDDGTPSITAASQQHQNTCAPGLGKPVCW